MRFQKRTDCLFIFFLFFGSFFYACKDKDLIRKDSYDPGKPTVFSDFSPKQGAIRTRLYIYGDNFGTDVSKIHVYIGERELKVVGANGKQIYCWVPGQTSTGQVRVVIDGNTPVEHTFADLFTYTKSTTVGTLVGNVDELGNSSIVDGDFENARFSYPAWVTYEPESNVLFVTELDRAVRRLDLTGQTVSTLITNGQAAFTKMQTTTLSSNKDTLFLSDDNGNLTSRNKVAIAYTLRSENYRRVHPYIYDPACFSAAPHPVTNEMFYNGLQGIGIKKAIPDLTTGELLPKLLFRVGGSTNQSSLIFFHPSGNYAYIVSFTRIYKSIYNWETRELEPPILFAGSATGGDVDAIGTSARIGRGYQGVFVKNPAYAGQADEYDFYFCDQNNQSIRTLSPAGVVTTFAGKGSPTPDGSVKGYIDGDPRKEARFADPTGIDYDAERKIFYIAERDNKRIRTITVE
ncbi:IPT/TIG domain-containing protein [Niabella beijingensis]|uniref:IPT/TIG domain-containing protein n=1 Tax=Niabella beijingensis TaxID=2872700 RepID=UPI001CBF00AE|nr:IPT/TIG domain-containing protein [Niabella beijingensis]MBZ4191329.1 IPT/TIG domain-containing protein [Niabella beijingensis]